jgi:hypothetical protein
MKHPNVRAFARVGLFIFLIGFFPFVFSCATSNPEDPGDFGSTGNTGNLGGNTGGNTGGGGFRQSSGSLFITDNLSDTFLQVVVTVYKVEFVETAGTVRTVFTSDPGVTYDLRHLSGVLSPLSTGLPAGSYKEVRITVGEIATLIDNTGPPKNPTFAQSESTTCSAGRCIISVTGTFNVVANMPVVLDFDLKQFTFDSVTNTVTAKVVVDPDGSRHDTYVEEQVDGPGAKGMVLTLRPPDGFDLTLFRAVGFTPLPNSQLQVKVNSDTKYICDAHDNLPQCHFASFDDVTGGLTVKVKGTWDGTIFTAAEVAVSAHDDIDFSRLDCTTPARSNADFTSLVRKDPVAADSYTFNKIDSSITVGDKVILITKETFIKLFADSAEQIICADEIPAAAGKVRVGFYEAKDASDKTVFIASKIRLGTEPTFDFGSGSGSGSFGDPGFGSY